MITKERLEELIEQGATIVRNSVDWDSGKSMGIDEIKLNNNHKITGNNCDNRYSLMYNGTYTSNLVEDLKNLYENIDDYNWHKEFGCIERTERLELPTWEEFNKMSSFIFESKDRTDMEMAIWFNSQNDDIKTIRITNLNDWNICCFELPLTKENYTLACRKAKELFLGEKK